MGSVALQLSHVIINTQSRQPDQGPYSNYMFYGGAYHLWVPSMALASCHQTNLEFWGGPPNFWKFVAPALAD
jgi:hypothetical protein